jgi:hypothetical protein
MPELGEATVGSLNYHFEHQSQKFKAPCSMGSNIKVSYLEFFYTIKLFTPKLMKLPSFWGLLHITSKSS